MIKLLRVIIVSSALLCINLYGADPSPEQRLELTELVNTWIKAEVESDRDALAAILHDDFVSTFASGKTINKNEYLDFIIGLDISPFSVINESMFVHGDTAVVIDVLQRGTTKFTYIAQKQNGQWLVLVQTFTTVKQAN